MPDAHSGHTLKIRLCSCRASRLFLITTFVLIFHSTVFAGERFNMPDLASLTEAATTHGEVDILVGQRHYSGEPVTGWGEHHEAKSPFPVYHVYGLGGGGLTLAPAIGQMVAEDVVAELLKTTASAEQDKTEIIVLGAGFVGIFSALELRSRLDQLGLSDINVRVIANALPKGISTIVPGTREPARKDNYTSQISGGWVMPVSVKPFSNHKHWCKLVKDAQTFWQDLNSDPVLSQTVRMTRTLVFYDRPVPGGSASEDKSGIRQVNELCRPAIYPESQFEESFYGKVLTSNANEQDWHNLHFDQVVAFDGVIQTETISILAHFIRQLLSKKVELTQVESLNSADSLQQHFRDNTRTIVINASGNGACAIFGCQPSRPVRGELVVLRVPLSHVDADMRKASEFSYWAGGTNYVFMRYPLNRPWLEVVMGGTFLENDSDLSIRPKTIRQIFSFWLDFFHAAPDGQGSPLYQRSKTNLTDQLLKKIAAAHPEEKG